MTGWRAIENVENKHELGNNELRSPPRQSPRANTTESSELGTYKSATQHVAGGIVVVLGLAFFTLPLTQCKQWNE